MAAADGVNSISFTLLYGSKKHDAQVDLPPENAGDVLIVRHLQRVIQRITEIPVENQRLIFKGKQLSNPITHLKDCGFTDGSKVMLIGSKPEETDPAALEVKDCESTLSRLGDKVTCICSDLDGLQQNFLTKKQVSTQLGVVSRQLRNLHGDVGRVIERLDALQLVASGQPAAVPVAPTTGASREKLRARRKALVDRAIKHQERCDTLQKSVSDILSQIEKQ